MLYISLFIAGFILILTPGPVFMANITLVAQKGRLEALKLSSGALLGDLFWLALVFISFVKANDFPPIIFNGLSLLCGAYIIYLAYKIYAHAKDPVANEIFENPFKDGIVVGFLNPKSYPVMAAIFAAPIYANINNFSWADLPFLLLISGLGFIASYALAIFIIGFPPIKSFYKRYATQFSYAFAAIFCYFGVSLLLKVFI